MMNMRLLGLLWGLWVRPSNLGACCGFTVHSSPGSKTSFREAVRLCGPRCQLQRALCVSSAAFLRPALQAWPFVTLHIGFLTVSQRRRNVSPTLFYVLVFLWCYFNCKYLFSGSRRLPTSGVWGEDFRRRWKAGGGEAFSYSRSQKMLKVPVHQDNFTGFKK